MRKRFAVIPTRDRPTEYRSCYDAIRPQVDDVVSICHSPQALHYSSGVPIRYDAPLPNISAMWNLGLECLDRFFHIDYDVAILNDDAIVPGGWFDRIIEAMDETGAVAGSADQFGRPLLQLLTTRTNPDISRRLSGFAFILDGSAGLRADEQFQWWWGDTDLDWRARMNGGTVLVPGVKVDHPENGGGTTVGRLAEIAGQDRERFIQKWGSAPW